MQLFQGIAGQVEADQGKGGAVVGMAVNIDIFFRGYPPGGVELFEFGGALPAAFLGPDASRFSSQNTPTAAGMRPGRAAPSLVPSPRRAVGAGRPE